MYCGGVQGMMAGKDEGKMAAALLPPGQVGELLGGQAGRAAPAVLGPMASPQDTLKLLTTCSEYAPAACPSTILDLDQHQFDRAVMMSYCLILKKPAPELRLLYGLWSFNCKSIDVMFHSAGFMRDEEYLARIVMQSLIHPRPQPAHAGVPSPTRSNDLCGRCRCLFICSEPVLLGFKCKFGVARCSRCKPVLENRNFYGVFCLQPVLLVYTSLDGLLQPVQAAAGGQPVAVGAAAAATVSRRHPGVLPDGAGAHRAAPGAV